MKKSYFFILLLFYLSHSSENQGEIDFETLISSSNFNESTTLIFKNVSNFLILKTEKFIKNNLNMINENQEKMKFQFLNGSFQIFNRSNITLINFKFSILQEKLIFNLQNAGTFFIHVTNLYNYFEFFDFI